MAKITGIGGVFFKSRNKGAEMVQPKRVFLYDQLPG